MGFSIAPGFFEALADSLEEHADRDGLTGVERAVFLARGGHAPGTACLHEPPAEHHHQGCAWFMGEDCDFGCGSQPADSGVPS